MQGWLGQVKEVDGDANCQMMAEACLNLQASLAARALQCLEAGPRGGSGGAGSLVVGPGGLARQGVSLGPAPGVAAQIKLPLISELSLV